MNKATLQERFESKIQRIKRGFNHCWIWKGAKDGCGYGKFTIGSRTDKSRKLQSAHRYSYERYIGLIPNGKLVLHTCDLPLCVNPKHLILGTQGDNVRASIERGRWVQALICAKNLPKTGKGVDNANYRHGRYVGRNKIYKPGKLASR